MEDEIDYALITLAARAEEHRNPDSLFKDRRALEWHSSMVDQGILPRNATLNPIIQAGIALRTVFFDYAVLSHVNRRPQEAARVYELGCGYSTRPYRLRSLPATWINVDKPDVMKMRKELPGIASWYEINLSADLEDYDFTTLGEDRLMDAIFVFEGVLTYMPLEKVQRMFDRLRDRFPGSFVVGTAALTGRLSDPLPVKWTVENVQEIEDQLGVDIKNACRLNELSHRFGFKMAVKLPASGYIWVGTLRYTAEQAAEIEEATRFL